MRITRCTCIRSGHYGAVVVTDLDCPALLIHIRMEREKEREKEPL